MIDLLSCDICHGLDTTLCPECSQKHAYRCDEAIGRDCFECGEEMDEDDAWVSAPRLDPNGYHQSHYCHEQCLPHGSIPVRD